MGPHGEQVLPAGDQRAWLHEAQLGARLSGNHEDVEATCGRLRSQTDSFWQRLMPILGREPACGLVEPLPKIGMMFAVRAAYSCAPQWHNGCTLDSQVLLKFSPPIRWG